MRKLVNKTETLFSTSSFVFSAVSYKGSSFSVKNEILEMKFAEM